MKIRADQIERLEEKFGADHIRVGGGQRKGRRFDDEESPRYHDAKRRPVPATTTTTSAPATPPATPTTPPKTTQTTATPRTTRPTVTPTATPPAMKKEEPIVNKPTIVKSFAAAKAVLLPQDSMETCPACGYRKPKEIEIKQREGGVVKVRPIVCKGCSDRYHQYGAEVAVKLAKGEHVVILTRHTWILSQLDLARFASELNEAFKEKERLNAEVQTKLATHGRLPREVFVPLRDRLQQETGASAAYGKWRRLQARLEAATKVRPEVEKMVAEEAAKNSATKATAETEVPTKPPATKPVARKKAKAAK